MEGVQCDRKSVLNFLLRSYIRVCNLDSYRAMSTHEHAETTLQKNFIANFNKEHPAVEVLMTGSKFEGLALPDVSTYSGKLPWNHQDPRLILSDLDFMFVDNNCPVGDAAVAGNETARVGYFASMDFAYTHPGYVRLAPVCEEAKLLSNDSHVDTNLFKEKVTQFTQVKELFHAIKDETVSLLNKPETEFKHSHQYIHGPALTVNVPHNMGSSHTEVDILGSLPVPEWPTIASEWSDRYRKYDWPTKELKETIVKGGCHVVPVSHATSVTPNLEWRLSFSRGEKVLARSLNNTQRQCYMLLKILYYYELKHLGGIASYHLKTSLFWACERTPTLFWTPESMLDCFNYLLDTVIHFLVSAHLPNYFLPINNMLDNICSSTRVLLLRKVVTIRKEPFRFLLPHQCVYNNNLDSNKEVLQIIWSQLFLQPYSSDTVYMHSSSILDQVTQPILDQLSQGDHVIGQSIVQACLKLATAFPSIKSSNHAFAHNNENATVDFFKEFATILNDMFSTDISYIELVRQIVQLVFCSQAQNLQKRDLAQDWGYFLQYILRSDNNLSGEERYQVTESLACMYCLRAINKTNDNIELSYIDRINIEEVHQIIGNMNGKDQTPTQTVIYLNLLTHMSDTESLIKQLTDQTVDNEQTVALVLPSKLYTTQSCCSDTLWKYMLRYITSNSTNDIEVYRPLWDSTLIEAVSISGGRLSIHVATLVKYMHAHYLSKSTDNTEMVSQLMPCYSDLSSNPIIAYLFGCIGYDVGSYQQAYQLFEAVIGEVDICSAFGVQIEMRQRICQLALMQATNADTVESNYFNFSANDIGNLAQSNMMFNDSTISSVVETLLHMLARTPIHACRQLLADIANRSDNLARGDVCACICLARLFLIQHNHTEQDIYQEAANSAVTLLESFVIDQEKDNTYVNTYLALYNYSMGQTDKVILHTVTAMEQLRVAMQNSYVPDFVILHHFEMKLLPKILHGDIGESQTLYMPCVLLQLLVMWSADPLVLFLYQQIGKDNFGEILIPMLQCILDTDIGDTLQLTSATVESEIKALAAVVTGHLLMHLNCFLQAREVYIRALRVFPRKSEITYSHIRKCENEFLKFGLLAILEGHFQLAFASFLQIWNDGLPLCKLDCSICLHIACQVYDTFLEALSEHKEHCIHFILFMLNDSDEFITEQHRSHMWMLLACMYYSMYTSCEGHSKKILHESRCCFAMDKAVDNCSSGALQTLYGNFLCSFERHNDAIEHLRKAVCMGRGKHTLHDHKAKTVTHSLITEIHGYPAHGFVECDALFEIFAASTPLKHYDFYVVYSSYLLVKAQCKMNIPCEEDVRQFQAICEEVGFCNGKWYLLGIVHMQRQSFAAAEIAFTREIEENKFYMDAKKLGMKMKVASHCCTLVERCHPAVAKDISETCMQIMSNCRVKLEAITKHCYLTYVPVDDPTLSDVIVTKLAPLMSAEAGNTSLLEEILSHICENLAEESTSGVAASQLGTVLYCKYKIMPEGDEKVKTGALIEGYFRDGIQSLENPLAQTCLQYAMFRLQEDAVDDDALVAAQKGFNISLTQLQQILSMENLSEADEKKMNFYDRALEQGIGLVLTMCVLLGKVHLAIDEHERAMNMKQRIVKHASFDQDILVNSLNQHALNISQHTQNIDLIVQFQAAVIDRYHEASESALASLSSNLACMLNSAAMVAKCKGAISKMESLLANAESHFCTAMMMSEFSPALIADYSGFYYNNEKYDKALTVITHLALTEENRYSMNGYGVSEKLCVDSFMREEIDNDMTGQGVVVFSHLYAAYIKIACLVSLGTKNQAECEDTLQQMVVLCADQVIASPISYRIMGYAYLRAGNPERARCVFNAALELNTLDPFTHKCILTYCGDPYQQTHT